MPNTQAGHCKQNPFLCLSVCLCERWGWGQWKRSRLICAYYDNAGSSSLLVLLQGTESLGSIYGHGLLWASVGGCNDEPLTLYCHFLFHCGEQGTAEHRK